MKKQLSFDGFEPANTTPVPDVLFDELLPYLSEAELKVLLYIIRRTAGFKKTDDAISLSQFQNGITKRNGEVLDQGCGVKNRTTISNALVSLEKKGCIQSEKGDDPQGDKATTVYKVRFQSDGVVRNSYHGSTANVPPVVTETYHGSTQAVPGVVRKTYPQETVIQETDSQLDSIQEDTNVATSLQEDRTPAPVDFMTESAKLRAASARRQALFADVPLSRDEGEDISLQETRKQEATDPQKIIAQTPDAGAAIPPSSGAGAQAPIVSPSSDAAQRTATGRGGAVQASDHIPDAGNMVMPPMALTAKSIKAQAEKREKELWSIIEAERNTKYTATQRRLYENLEGMKCLIADDISDEAVCEGLQKLDKYQRANFTVLKFYGWLPNLQAKEPIPIEKRPAPARDSSIGVSGLPRLQARKVNYG